MSDEGEKASWLEPLPDEYITGDGMTGRRMVIALFTVVILAVFGGLVWYSYLEGTDNGPIPVVHADKSVVKEKPDTPGGMQVLDQDKRVFNRVASQEADNNEKLAPSAELPIERPDEITSAEETLPLKLMTKEETLPPRTSSQDESKVISSAAVKNAVKTVPAVVIKIGDFLVQLGAFGKKDSAEQLWQKVKKENSALLKGLSSDVMMIDLGEKGYLYRLRGGMINDRSSADKICVALKAKKQACIVVEK